MASAASLKEFIFGWTAAWNSKQHPSYPFHKATELTHCRPRLHPWQQRAGPWRSLGWSGSPSAVHSCCCLHVATAAWNNGLCNDSLFAPAPPHRVYESQLRAARTRCGGVDNSLDIFSASLRWLPLELSGAVDGTHRSDSWRFGLFFWIRRALTRISGHLRS